MKKLTDEQARIYIQGEEPFDYTEYEKNHIKRLAKTVREYEPTEEEHKKNFKKTVLHWIKLHKNAKNINVLINEYKKRYVD